MLTAQRDNLKPREKKAKDIAKQQVLRTWGANHYFFYRHISRKEAISKVAGEQIAYYDDAEVKGLFDELGSEICGRLGWIAHQGTISSDEKPQIGRLRIVRSSPYNEGQPTTKGP